MDASCVAECVQGLSQPSLASCEVVTSTRGHVGGSNDTSCRKVLGGL
jgi:hypothetical protein